MSEYLPGTIRGVIFDCDGVLIDSRNANITYYNKLLEAVGRPHMDPEQEEFVHMASERQAVAHILSPEEVVRYDEVAAKVPYKKVVLPLLELETGARGVLLWLRERGVRLAVHTNRGRGMWDLLDKFRLRDVFDPVMTVEVVAPKPSSEGVRRILDAWKLGPESVVFVGDSLADASAAGGESVPFVAFRNEKLDARKHVGGFAQLRALLEPRIPSGGPRSSETVRLSR